MLHSTLAALLRFDIEGLACVVGIIVIVLLATSTRRVSRRCPRCREINREPAVFCAQCGAKLPGR